MGPKRDVRTTVRGTPRVPAMPFGVLLLGKACRRGIVVSEPGVILIKRGHSDAQVILTRATRAHTVARCRKHPMNGNIVILRRNTSSYIVDKLAICGGCKATIRGAAVRRVTVFKHTAHAVVVGDGM